VFGFDPIGRAQQWLFGDWEAFAAMSPVTTNVGEALAAMAHNVQTGAAVLRDLWTGNGGEGACRFLTEANDAVFTLRGPLGTLSESYSVMASAVWSMGEALGGVIKALLSSAIIAGIAGRGRHSDRGYGDRPGRRLCARRGLGREHAEAVGQSNSDLPVRVRRRAGLPRDRNRRAGQPRSAEDPNRGGRYTHPAI
jgi:hypothetical protein